MTLAPSIELGAHRDAVQAGLERRDTESPPRRPSARDPRIRFDPPRPETVDRFGGPEPPRPERIAALEALDPEGPEAATALGRPISSRGAGDTAALRNRGRPVPGADLGDDAETLDLLRTPVPAP